MPTANVTISSATYRFVLTPVLLALLLFSISLHGFAQNNGPDALAFSECWRYRTAELDPATAVSDSNNIYFGERSGRVSAISTADGKRAWASEVGGELVSNFILSDRELRFVTRSTDNSYELRSLSVLSGIANRSEVVPVRGRVRIYAASRQIIVVSDAGDLAAIDPTAGKLVWTKKLEANIKVVVSQADELIIGLGDGRIILIDCKDGRLMRTMSTKFVPSALLFSDDHLLVGDERGNITNLEVDKNSSAWSFRSGGKISGIYSVGDSDLLVTSFDNFAYLVDRQTGHVVWKRRQSSRIIDAAIIGSKYAGVTPFGEPAIFFLDPENGKSIGQLVMPNSIEFVQPAQLVGGSVITFTNEGLVSTGFSGCKQNEKAEAKTSAFK